MKTSRKGAVIAESFPTLIYPIPSSLGLYLRPGRRDHKPVVSLLAESQNRISGVVIDPVAVSWQAELLAEAPEHRVETVLDPKTIEMATPGGFNTNLAKLPWASEEPHRVELLAGLSGEQLAHSVAEFVVGNGLTAVLAPTHYLDDPRWFAVDRQLTRQLRSHLDAAGATEVPIYYVLSMPSTQFHDPGVRSGLIDGLRGLPIDAVWLRIHPFGGASGPLALKRYIRSCQDFHQLGFPLIGEKTGFAGLALMAFGAVGGCESGITVGERFDAGNLVRPRGGRPFLPPPRVYISELGLFLSRKRAEAFFDNRYMKSRFACKDRRCCRRGLDDMMADPRRHFLIRRSREVARLSRVPHSLRAERYLERVLRPATDLAVAAARADASLEGYRHRLDSWRATLGSFLELSPPTSYSAVPDGRRMKARLRA